MGFSFPLALICGWDIPIANPLCSRGNKICSKVLLCSVFAPFSSSCLQTARRGWHCFCLFVLLAGTNCSARCPWRLHPLKVGTSPVFVCWLPKLSVPGELLAAALQAAGESGGAEGGSALLVQVLCCAICLS